MVSTGLARLANRINAPASEPDRIAWLGSLSGEELRRWKSSIVGIALLYRGMRGAEFGGFVTAGRDILRQGRTWAVY